MILYLKFLASWGLLIPILPKLIKTNEQLHTIIIYNHPTFYMLADDPDQARCYASEMREEDWRRMPA